MSGTTPEAKAASCLRWYSAPATIVCSILTFGFSSSYRLASETIARAPPWLPSHGCRNSIVSACPVVAALAGAGAVDGLSAGFASVALAASAGLASAALDGSAGLASLFAGAGVSAGAEPPQAATTASVPDRPMSRRNERRDARIDKSLPPCLSPDAAASWSTAATQSATNERMQRTPPDIAGRHHHRPVRLAPMAAWGCSGPRRDARAQPSLEALGRGLE